MRRLIAGTCVLVLILSGCQTKPGAERGTPDESQVGQELYVTAATTVEAGRYLVTVAGCNDCHTDGYLATNGDVPESEWLTGSSIGFRGPWGTSYPANLRATVQNLTEDAWVEMLRTRKAMPPMPWMNVNKISDRDLRAIYQYIKSMGLKGEMAPAFVQPGQEPSTPYIDFVPKNLPGGPQPIPVENTGSNR